MFIFLLWCSGITIVLTIILCLLTKLIIGIIKKINHKTFKTTICNNLQLGYLAISMLSAIFIVLFLDTELFYDDEKYKAENTTNTSLFCIDNEKCEDIYLIDIDSDVFVYNDGVTLNYLHVDDNINVTIENSDEIYLVVTEYKYYNEWYELEHNNKIEYKFFINNEYILN